MYGLEMHSNIRREILETFEKFLYLQSPFPFLSARGSRHHQDRDIAIFRRNRMERQITLIIHFIGLGLFVTTFVAGFILNRQYTKANDLQTKATILRGMRPIGLLSPFASLIMLVTGIGNMHILGYSLFELPPWLAYKIVFFAIALISGVIFSIRGRKRGAIIQQMVAGSAPANAEVILKSHDQQIRLSYLIMPILFLIILTLSVFGRTGAL